MSEPFFNNRKNQLKFINLCIGAHDIGCDCDTPGFHTLKLLTQQIYPELEDNHKKEIKNSLGGEDDAAAAGGTDDLGEELERLFAQDTTDDDG